MDRYFGVQCFDFCDANFRKPRPKKHDADVSRVLCSQGFATEYDEVVMFACGCM